MDNVSTELARVAGQVGALSGLKVRSGSGILWIDQEFDDDFLTLGWELGASLEDSSLNWLDPVRLPLREPGVVLRTLAALGREELVLSVGQGRLEDRWVLRLGERILGEGGLVGAPLTGKVVLLPGGAAEQGAPAVDSSGQAGVGGKPWQSELARVAQRLGPLLSITAETASASLAIDVSIPDVDLWLAWWLHGELSTSYLDEISPLEWWDSAEAAVEVLRRLGREDLILVGSPRRLFGRQWALRLGGDTIGGSLGVKGPWRDHVLLLPAPGGLSCAS